jgi:protein SCO1
MRFQRSWIAWAALAIVAAGCGAWLARQHDSSGATLASGTWLPEARPVPEFALVDQSGKPFSAEDLRGRPSLVFFGFTHCPHVCPTTLAKLAQVRRDAGVRDLRVIMVSVDPERDTPAALAAYLGNFDPEFIGLTGERSTIEALAKSLGVAAARTDLPGDTYTVDHTSAVFLMDSRARLVGVFTPPIDSPALAADLRGVAARLASG